MAQLSRTWKCSFSWGKPGGFSFGPATLLSEHRTCFRGKKGPRWSMFKVDALPAYRSGFHRSAQGKAAQESFGAGMSNSD